MATAGIQAPSYADGINGARQAGYSDDEIAQHLSQTEPGIQKAIAVGYSSKEALDYLAQPSTEGGGPQTFSYSPGSDNWSTRSGESHPAAPSSTPQPSGPSIGPAAPSFMDKYKRALFGGAEGETPLGRAFPSMGGGIQTDTPTKDLNLVNLGELAPSQSELANAPKWQQAAGAAEHGIFNAASGLTTPTNLGIMAGTSGMGAVVPNAGYTSVLGQAINAGLGAYFTYEMGKGTFDAGRSAYQKHINGDDMGAIKDLGFGTAEAFLTYLGLKHGVKSVGDILHTKVPKPALNPEVLPPEPQTAPAGVGAASPQTVDTEPQTTALPKRETPKPSKTQTVSPSTPNPPTAAIPTAPENPATLQAQTEQLSNGQRRVVMYPKGTPAPLTFPSNSAVTSDKFGNTYVFRPDLIARSAIKKAAENNTLHEILGDAEMGLGAPDKGAIPPDAPAVVVRDQLGNEVQSTLSPPETLSTAVQAGTRLMPPGGSVKVEPPAGVIGERGGTPPAPAETPPPTQIQSAEPVKPIKGASDEMFRGSWDLPLNQNGLNDAQKIADETAGQWDQINSSTLHRARQTVAPIAQANPQAPVHFTDALRPMHLGGLEGQPVTPEAIDAMNQRIAQQPSEPFPGTSSMSGMPGDSFNQFRDRVIGHTLREVEAYRPGTRVLNVTHYRDLQVIKAWLKAGAAETGEVDVAEMTKKGDQKPGNLFRLTDKALVPAQDASQPGIYFLRHGETMANDGAAKPSADETAPPKSETMAAPGETPLESYTRSRSVTLGAGLGSIAPFFKESVADMKALAEKRSAALEALKAASATPGEQRWGHDVLTYFTGERDFWEARVNQAIEKLRRELPNRTDQEAISLMRDFANKPGELQQWLNGTHPDYPTTPEGIRNLKRIEPVIKRALSPTQKMLDVNVALTGIATASLQEGKRLKFLNSNLTPEEYVTHILQPKEQTAIPQPLTERAAKMMGGKLGRRFAYAAKRGYPTLLHALADNVKPRTLNALDAFTIYGDKFATSRASHMLVKELKDSGIGVWGTHNSDNVPIDWVEIAPHAHPFRNVVPYTDATTGQANVAMQTLFVPKFVADALRPITDPDATPYIPYFVRVTAYQNYVKAVQLGLSLFHVTTENYMALADMGAKGRYLAARNDRFGPTFQAAERDAIIHGMTTSIGGKAFDVYRSLDPGSIPSWGDIWKKAPIIKQLDEVSNGITEYTFNNMVRRFKVTSYQMKVAGWLAKHPNASSGQIRVAKQSFAKHINSVYGGLHWENLGWNKMAVRIAKAFIMAPDWSFSNIVAADTAARDWKTPAGKASRLFWIKLILGGLIATQLTTYMLTGHWSPHPTEVVLGKDKDGKEIRQNIFFKGSSGDLVNAIHNIADYGVVLGLVRTMSNKMAAIPRTAAQLMANRNFIGKEIVPKGMNPVAGTVRGGIAAIKGIAPVPLSLGNAFDMLTGPDHDKYTVPEFLTTALAGTPPRHVVPEGQHLKNGVVVPDKPKGPDRSIMDQIKTGKTSYTKKEQRQLYQRPKPQDLGSPSTIY